MTPGGQVNKWQDGRAPLRFAEEHQGKISVHGEIYGELSAPKGRKISAPVVCIPPCRSACGGGVVQWPPNDGGAAPADQTAASVLLQAGCARIGKGAL